MNKRNVEKTLILALFIFGITISTVHGDDYFKEFVCEQDISTSKDLTPVYMNTSMTITWYEKDGGDTIMIGDFRTELVDYIFWKGTFYGKTIAIAGAENINTVLRFLQDSYGQPVSNFKKNVTLWRTDTYVFHLTRFSYHLSQMDILCKDMFFDIEAPE